MKQTIEGVSLALRELSGVFDTELVLEGSVLNCIQEMLTKEYAAARADAVALSLHPQTLMGLTKEIWESPYGTLNADFIRGVGLSLSHIISWATGSQVLVTHDSRLLWTEADIVWKR